MNISDALNLLKRVQKAHGEVEVYFDCPHCKQSFTPGTVVTQAVVLNGEPKR